MKIIFLAFLVLLGGSSLCEDDLPVALAFANGDGTNSSLPTVRDLIDQVLGSMSHQANLPLSSIMPEASRISLATPNRIEQCYDSSIGDSDSELVNIFEQPLDEIVLKFVNTFKSWLIDAGFEEFKSRIKTLLANIVFVAGQVLECALNTDPDYEPTRLGLTPFAIYTHAEFVAKFSDNSLLAQNYTEIEGEKASWWPPQCKISADPVLLKGVTAFDWRNKGVVTEVRHQGGCKSCYIFSAVGAMESAYMLQVDNSSLTRFSEQQFVDCNFGCDKGGLMPKVWDAATKDGLVLADRYPHKYVAKQLECMLNQSKPVFATLEDYCEDHYLSKDEQLMTMIYQYGPTSIAINATSPDFSHLKGPWNRPCNASINHAVLAVGWDEEYWIIKNSWGPGWGIGGYLYLAKKQTNICGIYNRAGLPFFHKRK